VTDQVSRPYRTTGKSIGLNTFIFMFLDSRHVEGGRERETVSELHGSKHSPNLICSQFIRECNFGLLSSFASIWTLLHQRIYLAIFVLWFCPAIWW
jgi:hypothetical protein